MMRRTIYRKGVFPRERTKLRPFSKTLRKSCWPPFPGLRESVRDGSLHAAWRDDRQGQSVGPEPCRKTPERGHLEEGLSGTGGGIARTLRLRPSHRLERINEWCSRIELRFVHRLRYRSASWIQKIFWKALPKRWSEFRNSMAIPFLVPPWNAAARLLDAGGREGGCMEKHVIRFADIERRERSGWDADLPARLAGSGKQVKRPMFSVSNLTQPCPLLPGGGILPRRGGPK